MRISLVLRFGSCIAVYHTPVYCYTPNKEQNIQICVRQGIKINLIEVKNGFQHQ